jgi:cytochrome c-type biogenesis protein CcmE
VNAIAMIPVTENWQVVTRDVLGAGIQVENVQFWVLVCDASRGFGILPMVLRDGQLVAAQGKLRKIDS